MKVKHLFLGMAFSLAGLNAGVMNAQDIITKTNGDEIQVKVTKITDTQIEYKKFSNPDGPVYTINKKEIFRIKYENGETEVISGLIEKRQMEEQASQKTNTVASSVISSAMSSPTPRTPMREKKVLFGFKTGLNLSNISSDASLYEGEYAWDKSSKFGFGGGFFMEFRITDWLAIRPEFLISMKGYKDEGYTTLTYYTYYEDNPSQIISSEEWIAYETSGYNFTYLEVPLNILFRVPVGNSSFNIGGGAYVAYAIWGKRYSDYTVNGTDIHNLVNHIEEDLEESDLFTGDINYMTLLTGALILCWNINCRSVCFFRQNMLLVCRT
ncbi:MAG: PorT family protein [Bacteroidales bacterium]|jgi:hypothetical protein|nr:PorT family protein [Bacteroidales bacterium]